MSPVISSVCSTLVGTFGIEPARLGMRGDRLFVESAVAAGVDEPREQLRIVAVTTGLAQQAHERPLRLADVRLEVCVELVRDREARIELERAAEGVFGARLAIWCAFDVLADHAVAATEVSPRGSEARIQLQAALIQLARAREAVVGARELVRAEVELVGAGVVRRVRAGRRRRLPPAEATAPPRRAWRCRPAAGTDRRATTGPCAT